MMTFSPLFLPIHNNLYFVSFLITINPLLSPPLSNKPLPSNKPPLFRGRKLISPFSIKTTPLP